MSSTITLAPCPKCGYARNQGRVEYKTYLIGGSLMPSIQSEVSCLNCGFFYDGRTNSKNMPPAKFWLIGFFLSVAISMGVIVVAIVGVVIYGLVFY